MTSFTEKALELLNLKNFILVDNVKKTLDEEVIRISDELKKLNKKIDVAYKRMDAKEEQIQEMEKQKQIKLDELHELFYKDI